VRNLSPLLDNIPKALASELGRLLYIISQQQDTEAPASFVATKYPSQYLTPLDIRHQQHARIQTLNNQIRSLPEHENFMRGLPFDRLIHCAANYVVMLIATHGEHHALILKSNKKRLTSFKLHDITASQLQELSAATRGTSSRGATTDDNKADRLAMRKTRVCAVDVLGRLWTTVVKPILDHLQLKVCTRIWAPRSLV
jgi:hypothetical protein